MLLRIFIPESVYNNSNKTDGKCQYIYGAVEIEEADDISSFYVISSSASANQANQCKQIIGVISQDATTELSATEQNYLHFNRSGTALKLQSARTNSLSLDTSRKIQIFTYDSKIFAQLSQRYRNQHSRDDRQTSETCDPIGVLLRTIAEAKEAECLANTKHRQQACQSWIMHYAKAVKTFIHTHTTYIDSAFLKHFLLWTENLDRFTFQT